MLVVTIHDVAPSHLAAVRELRERVAEWGASCVTMLAVPDYHGRGRLASCAETTAWLRGWVRAGDEVALHGVEHLQRGEARGPLARLRARIWTAREGEMLGLDAPTAEQLVIERDRLQQVLSAPVTGFVAPAWLEPRTLAPRLGELGFSWHETKWRIESLQAPRRALVSPAIGFATRTKVREHASLVWAELVTPLARRTAGPLRPARVALHPSDLRSKRVLASAEWVVRQLARRHASVTTAQALAVAAARAPSRER